MLKNCDSNMLNAEELPQITEKVVRERFGEIPSGLAYIEKLEAGQLIEISIFPDANYSATVRRVFRDAMGTTTLLCDIIGFPSGNLTAVKTGEFVLVNISIPSQGKNYIVRYDHAANSYRFAEILLEELPFSEEAP